LHILTCFSYATSLNVLPQSGHLFNESYPEASSYALNLLGYLNACLEG